jgi:hypothetical protein
MTLPRSLASYGSPKKNARPTSNPKTDITQGDWNRLVGDVAALTGCPVKLRVIFATTTSNGAIAPTWFASQWGNDSASAPVVQRTGTGVYTLATPSAWATPGTWVYSLDPDQVTSTSEQVIWTFARGEIDTLVSVADGKVRNTRSGYTITLNVTNTSGTLSDLGGGIPIYVEAG